MKRRFQEKPQSSARDEAFTRLKNFVDLNSREHVGTTQCRYVYPFIAVSCTESYIGDESSAIKRYHKPQS
jgi:hypothetical protein